MKLTSISYLPLLEVSRMGGRAVHGVGSSGIFSKTLMHSSIFGVVAVLNCRQAVSYTVPNAVKFEDRGFVPDRVVGFFWFANETSGNRLTMKSEMETLAAFRSAFC